MKKEVIEKIDLLVEMSGTTNKYETLNEELNVVDSEIESEKNKINDLKKKLSSDFNYTRSNEKIVDENTKMGLENRRVIASKDLEEIKDSITELSKEEESCHESLTEVENELKQSRHFIESLELKMKTNSSNKESYRFYETLLDKNHNTIKEKENLKKEKQQEYNRVVKKIEDLGIERDDLENRLKDLDSKLAIITESLINPKSYIDQKNRQKDERLLEKYKEELDRLETRRIAIITDPAYIGHEAQELYLESDKTSTLEKIKELVTIVKAKDYMDTPLSEIASLLEKATNKRDEFASQINNKSYDVGDNSIVTLRIEYLKEQKKKKEKEIEELNVKINKIDDEEVKNLVRYVEDTRKYKEELANDIEIYKNVLNKENDNKSPKKQASLKAALLKKQEEYSLVVEILNSFENDLENRVIESKTLEEDGIEKLKKEIIKLDEQINKIERKEALNNNPKDILNIEKDREILKGLDDDVEALKHRQKYSAGASEILDQIEVAIETPEALVKTPVKEEKVEDLRSEFTIPNEYLPPVDEIETINILDDIKEEEPSLPTPPIENTEKEEVKVVPNRFKVIDMELLESNDEKEEVKNETSPIENNNQPLPEINDIEPKEYDPFASDANNVIEPIILNKDEEEKTMDNDILMQDEFQDTEYISFNDLLEGDN